MRQTRAWSACHPQQRTFKDEVQIWLCAIMVVLSGGHCQEKSILWQTKCKVFDCYFLLRDVDPSHTLVATNRDLRLHDLNWIWTELHPTWCGTLHFKSGELIIVWLHAVVCQSEGNARCVHLQTTAWRACWRCCTTYHLQEQIHLVTISIHAIPGVYTWITSMYIDLICYSANIHRSHTVDR